MGVDCMKMIKLSGRESSIVRAVDFAIGTPGSDLFERTRIELDELTALINGLMAVGFLECTPHCESLTEQTVMTALIEVNPGYAHELKAALYLRP